MCNWGSSALRPTTRQLIIWIVSLRFLLIGFEYAIIIPTLNLFLQSMTKGGSSSVKDLCQNSYSLNVGLCLSAMSFSSLLASPVFGRISDITRKTKTAVIIGNICEIGGNILYCVSWNPAVLIGSRLIVGVGTGPNSSILGMISRATTPQARTKLVSTIYTLRQVGVVIGPACNFFLKEFNFMIGTVRINEFTAPTMFMTILWIIHTVFVLFLFRDLPALSDSSTSENTSITSENTGTDYGAINSKSVDAEQVEVKVEERNANSSSFWRSLSNDLLTEEMIACLCSAFVIMFVQIGVEASVTPLTCRLFGWGDIDNSLYFLGTGILYVLCLTVLGRLSKKVSDELMVTVSLAGTIGSNLFFFFFAKYAVSQPQGTPWVLAMFIIYAVSVTFLFPFSFVPVVSLVSKITSEKNQGVMQGMQMLAMRVGQIMGPIWTTALVDSYIVLMAAVNLGVSVIPLVLFLFSYKEFDKRRRYIDNRQNISERTSLLSNHSSEEP